MSKSRKLKVLVGCEESQAVCVAFRQLGHEAFSCDLEPCSGGHPEWHLQTDVFKAIAMKQWDLGIFFPPCTYLTVSGNSWFSVEKYGAKAVQRWMDRLDAVKFFIKLYYSPIPHIGIENPVGYLSSAFRKPDQIIHPYYFGDVESKQTCLWLKNLPKLRYAKKDSLFETAETVVPNFITHSNGKRDPQWHFNSLGLPPKERAKIRSKTYPGIARAMAEQWSEYLLNL